MPDTSSSLLDAAHLAFITGAVGINLAACRPGGFPALSRAVGCRVSADCGQVSVLVGAAAAADVIDAVRRSGAVAVVFSDPPTHRTLQLKGSNALVLPPEPGDVALAHAYRDAFAAILAPFGFAEGVVRAFLSCPDDDLLAVRFSPSAAFSQTPGPHAGEPLAGRS